MEWKIGEIKQVNGEWYQCLESDRCNYCDLEGLVDCHNIACASGERSDSKDVIFKKLEKVGETVTVKGRTFQKLTSDNNSCKECVFNVPNKACCKNSYIEGICDDNGFWVEIKQSKEDMEEKEQCGDNRFEVIEKAKKHLLSSTNIESSKEEMKVLDNFLIRCWQMGWLDKYNDTKHSNSENIRKNLKEFDINLAKQGKPVCTRDGRKARLICFDKKGAYPIVALVNDYNEEEYIKNYDEFGKKFIGGETSDDLMMLPEKKEGWVNVYKERCYETREEAIRHIAPGTKYVDTIRVEWEE